MWFLGAGASASAGIPTAWNMIWDFKRTLYCAKQRIPLNYCQDLGDRRVRQRLQQFFDEVDECPPAGSDDEYVYYFESLYPNPADRRRYIDDLVTQGAPSYGHRVLAALMKMGDVRIVWTTNFDTMVEDALLPLLESSGQLITADLDNPRVVRQAINGGRWPILAKLHGDFRSRRLKNVGEELRRQDKELRYALVEACKRYGLAVVGYSGRDHSVMDALEDAIAGGRGFPEGLFWFHRPGSPPFERVKQLVNKAKAQEIDAHIIEVETFDELMADLFGFVPEPPSDVQQYLEQQPRWVSSAQIPETDGSWPILRFNALKVESWPAVCRLVQCDIGGLREVREAVTDADADVIAYRRKVGVIAFGSDMEIRRTFEPYNISDFDVYTIGEKRLFYDDSMELALLYDALGQALNRERPVKVVRRGRTYFVIAEASEVQSKAYARLRNVVDNVTGTISGTNVQWAEAVRLRLEHKLGRLWLLIEPTIWLESPDGNQSNATADEFVRQKLAKRYNKHWNAIIDGWANIFTGGNKSCTLSAFGISDGMDAQFNLSEYTAFSWRK